LYIIKLIQIIHYIGTKIRHASRRGTVLRIAHAKFHCNKLTTVRDIHFWHSVAMIFIHWYIYGINNEIIY